MSIPLHIFTDINECIHGNGGCEDTCHNTNGAYYCRCRTGTVLGQNKHICDGKKYFNVYMESFSIIMLMKKYIYSSMFFKFCKSLITKIKIFANTFFSLVNKFSF